MSLQRWDNLQRILLPNSLPSWSLELLYVSTAKYDRDWHSTLHAHQCTEIFYILHGTGNFRVEDTIFPVEKDYIIVVNPGVEHTEISSAQDPLEYTVLGMNGCEFLKEGHYQDSRYFLFTTLTQNHQILFYMQSISRELTQQGNHYQAVIEHMLQLIAISLLRTQSVTIQEALPNKVSLKCAQIKRYIDTHFKEHITIDTLANVTFLSKSYLIHIFTKEYGEPPMSYLVRRRVEESRYLLAQTNYSILEISMMLGFSSANYFGQSFRRLESISPREYRRRSKAEAEKEAAQMFDTY